MLHSLRGLWRKPRREKKGDAVPIALAIAAFERDQPRDEATGQMVVASEPQRWVVRVFYRWDGVAPRYVHYAVAKPSGRAVRLEDDKAYRTRHWR